MSHRPEAGAVERLRFTAGDSTTSAVSCRFLATLPGDRDILGQPLRIDRGDCLSVQRNPEELCRNKPREKEMDPNTPDFLTEEELEQNREGDVHEILTNAWDFWQCGEIRDHLEFVLNRLPRDAVNRLEEMNVLVFAPGRIRSGRFLKIPAQNNHRLVVFLSPFLLEEPADYVQFTIAHELAHAYLGHLEEPAENAHEKGLAQEAEVDQLAAEWGFPRPDTHSVATV